MTKKQQQVLIVILGSIAALGPFSIDMYLPGFPAIAEDLKTDEAHVSLTLTTYFIGISVGQLFYGPLLDRFGRKKPLLIGLVIYALAAIGCALSPDVWWLIGMRLVLALGGCVGMVACSAIIRDRFSANEVARAFSSILLVMGVAPVIAPTLGGLFTGHFGWRFIFAFLFVIAVLLITVIYFFLEESKGEDRKVSLKFDSIAGNYLAVLRNSDFVLYGLAGSIAMAIMFAYISGIPYIFMELYGVSETTFGWMFGLNAFGFITGSQINRFLLKRYDLVILTRNTSFIQLIVTSLLLVGVWRFELPLPVFAGLLFFILFLLGFINPNATALSLEPYASGNVGSASAMNGSFKMGAGAAISALMGIFHNGTVFPMVIMTFVLALVSFILLLLAKRKSWRIQERVYADKK
ncbi:multidrug effflux MFS transporter [Sinomicrobium weinanense]|uniref:Multidrug effflux MFS transporter n=1 Tax=Sinomicrobium weinanense TaxID=2842200 RepID=A0A926JW76_9FLAO|nr:multidrug effflux MFS transporter [Sinomicrobium weinanense]MBC9798620.1 multidrug effflux MFS transporter [Sinomicrobium weinanense]MBU3122123.1 multidrug effflux MFS transporter [Sinomicrobium weinanense]